MQCGKRYVLHPDPDQRTYERIQAGWMEWVNPVCRPCYDAMQNPKMPDRAVVEETMEEREDHEVLRSVNHHLERAQIEIRNAIQAALEADMDLRIIHAISKAADPIQNAIIYAGEDCL